MGVGGSVYMCVSECVCANIYITIAVIIILNNG